MDFFSYLKVYIYFDYNLQCLDYDVNAHIYHNILKFDNSKLIINKSWKLLNVVTTLMCS